MGETIFLRPEQTDGRYIYYLITKEAVYEKPTLEDIELSLIALKRTARTQNQKVIAIPKIASGLDKQYWPTIRKIIKRVFRGSGIDIHVYLNQTNPAPGINSRAPLVGVAALHMPNPRDRITELVPHHPIDLREEQEKDPDIVIEDG